MTRAKPIDGVRAIIPIAKANSSQNVQGENAQGRPTYLTDASQPWGHAQSTLGGTWSGDLCRSPKGMGAT
jgi:hypothetical protein